MSWLVAHSEAILTGATIVAGWLGIKLRDDHLEYIRDFLRSAMLAEDTGAATIPTRDQLAAFGRAALIRIGVKPSKTTDKLIAGAAEWAVAEISARVLERQLNGLFNAAGAVKA